jgi:uridine phosphorylase
MNYKDLIIEPRRGRKERLLPESAVLVVNPAEAESAFDYFTPYGGASRSLYQSRVVVDKTGRFCLVGPALGAAAAVLVLEKLIVLGVKNVWLLSCCGALDPALDIGDYLLARGAVSGEGVSPYYSAQAFVIPGSHASGELELCAVRCALEAGDGVLWSTDAPYRERRSVLAGLQERYGINGVDMEFSALATVARFRGISLGGLFVVSDMLWTPNWKPGFGGTGFKQSTERMIRAVIQFRFSEDCPRETYV